MKTKAKPTRVEFAEFTEAEMPHVRAIIDRAVKMFAKHGMKVTKAHMSMNLHAAHNVCPLDVARLAAADDFNFSHDVGGIEKHLNKRTGEIEDFFVPRFAKRDA